MKKYYTHKTTLYTDLSQKEIGKSYYEEEQKGVEGFQNRQAFRLVFVSELGKWVDPKLVFSMERLKEPIEILPKIEPPKEKEETPEEAEKRRKKVLEKFREINEKNGWERWKIQKEIQKREELEAIERELALKKKLKK